MNEILFRGKRFYDNKWVEGLYVEKFDSNATHTAAIAPKYPFEDSVHLELIKSDSVCQFTGCYDKKGKKIFEWDIVCCLLKVSRHHSIKINGYIAYNEKTASFLAYFGEDMVLSLSDSDRFEVIGNKFDNPELMELEG